MRDRRSRMVYDIYQEIYLRLNEVDPEDISQLSFSLVLSFSFGPKRSACLFKFPGPIVLVVLRFSFQKRCEMCHLGTFTSLSAFGMVRAFFGILSTTTFKRAGLGRQALIFSPRWIHMLSFSFCEHLQVRFGPIVTIVPTRMVGQFPFVSTLVRMHHYMGANELICPEISDIRPILS